MTSEVQSVESKPKWRRLTPRQYIAAGAIGVMGILDASIGVHALLSHKDPKPEFIFSGEVSRGGKEHIIKGLVNLSCTERGVLAAHVNAKVRLATITYDQNNGGTRGRVVKVGLEPGADDCATAERDVLNNPESVMAATARNVGSRVTGITGDGLFSPGEKYADEFKAALEDDSMPHYTLAP